MTIEEFNWDARETSADDQALIDAYVNIGTPLDALVYTERFKEVAKLAGYGNEGSIDDNDLHRAYRRLISLRKRGMLPRVYSGQTS